VSESNREDRAVNRGGVVAIGNFIESHSVDSGGIRCRINGNGNEWKEWRGMGSVIRCGNSVLGQRKSLAIDRGESCAWGGMDYANKFLFTIWHDSCLRH
jgi:hypothetical protein